MLKKKPKVDPTDTISVKVPAAMKASFLTLEKAAGDLDLDLRASLTDAVVKTLREAEKLVRQHTESRPHHAPATNSQREEGLKN